MSMLDTDVKYVAKQLEKMLETALAQLKGEQKRRKESDAEVERLKQILDRNEEQLKIKESENVGLQEKIAFQDSELEISRSWITDLSNTVKELLQEVKSKLDVGLSHGLVEQISRSFEPTNYTLESQELTNDQNNSFVVDGIKEEVKVEVNDNDQNLKIEDSLINNKSPNKNTGTTKKSVKKQKERPCNLCEEVFPTRKLLKQHKNISGHQTRFNCDKCEKTFKHKVNRIEHEESIHEMKRYQCSKCDRSFSTLSSRNRHELNDDMHEKLKTYTPLISCHLCGKQFTSKRKWCLDMHLKAHQAGNLLSCKFCKKIFRKQLVLNRHEKACSANSI